MGFIRHMQSLNTKGEAKESRQQLAHFFLLMSYV